MKDLLKHIPGFRSDTFWKKFIASTFYLLHILIFFVLGFWPLVAIMGIEMLGFSLVKLIVNLMKKRTLKTPAILFIAAILLISTGMTIETRNTAKIEEAEQVKLAEEEQKAKEEERRLAEETRKKEEEAKRKEEERLEQERLEEERLAKERKEELVKDFVSAEVIDHIEEDILDVKLEDEEVLRVRMLGVSTPDWEASEEQGEFYGEEAFEFTKEQLVGETIYLEKDISKNDNEDYALGYIWMDLPDEINREEIQNKMFNGILLAEGYAIRADFDTEEKYEEYFLQLAKESKEQNLGLWNENESAEFDRLKKEKEELAAKEKQEKEAREAKEKQEKEEAAAREKKEQEEREAAAAKERESASASNSSSTSSSSSSASSGSSNTNVSSAKSNTSSAPVAPSAETTAEVLITRTGKKYHKRACGRGDYFPATLSDAKARGLTPCAKCY